MKTVKPTALSAAILSALILGSGVAYAQSADEFSGQRADARVLDEITVSARGVAEPLQQMPLPITAISEKTIEKKGLVDIRDIAAMTPSFSFKSPYGRLLDRPVIRGMSNIQGEPNASFFIDGIFVQGEMSSYGLENIERVEVIRGPQSAAFGRRTFSGAVNFITRRPGTLQGGKLTLGAGNYGQEKMGLFWSGGSDDGTFGYDLSLNKRSNDGIFFNHYSDKRDLNASSSTSGMAAVAWSPTENLEITARLMNQKNRDSHAAMSRLGSDQLNCHLPQYTGDLFAGQFPILSTRSPGYFCGDLQVPDSYALNTPEYIAAGFMPGSKADILRSSVVVDYHFENGWNLSSTTAYNDTEMYNGTDLDYSSTRGFGGAFEAFTQSAQKDWSQDLRLSFGEGNPVSGLVGVYYYDQQAKPGWRGDLAGFFLPGNRSVVPVTTDPDDKTVNKAIYGMVNWEINDRWVTSFETRYARDEISKGGVDTRVLAGTTYSLPYAVSETFTSFTPRVTLSYRVSDAVSVYGLASKGTKPGGFNVDVYRADFKESERDVLFQRGLDTFAEEKAWNYEFGVKSDLLDGQLRLNANVFQIDWDNQQLTVNAPVVLKNDSLFSTSYTANIGESRVRGFELESQWAFADGWMATFAYSRLDAKIMNFINQEQADLFSSAAAPTLDDPAANAKGNLLPMVPKQQISAGVMYDGMFTNGWGYTASADVMHEGHRWVQIHNLAGLKASTVSNLRFSLYPTDAWRVTAFVRNAFNDNAPSGGQRTIDPTVMVARPNVPPLTGLGIGNVRDFGVMPSLPRMFGVEVSYSF